jgi:hypothetical protein
LRPRRDSLSLPVRRVAIAVVHGPSVAHRGRERRRSDIDVSLCHLPSRRRRQLGREGRRARLPMAFFGDWQATGLCRSGSRGALGALLSTGRHRFGCWPARLSAWTRFCRLAGNNRDRRARVQGPRPDLSPGRHDSGRRAPRPTIGAIRRARNERPGRAGRSGVASRTERTDVAPATTAELADQRFWWRNFITSSRRKRRSPRLQTR